MGVRQQIDSDLVGAVKARDRERATTLRMLSAAIRNEELKTGSPLADGDILRIVEREAKKRNEAAAGFEQGGRSEAAANERAEEKMLRAYLPPPMSDTELLKIIQEVVAAPSDSPRELSSVMRAVMAKLAGRADGARVRALVSRILGSE